jgi:hypothetical protein
MMYHEWDPMFGEPLENKMNKNKEFVLVKKTEEEIKKLMIDENLTEIERAIYIIDKG